MIQVYHFSADNEHSPYKAEQAIAAWKAGKYQLVATVDSPDLEYAWRRTNSVDSCWSLEPATGVTPMVPGKPCRSSMVGDIFMLDNRLMMVNSVGFAEIKA